MTEVKPQSTFGIAKALHYIIFGSEYLKDIIRQEQLKGYAKSVLTNYTNRLDWIVNDVFSKLGDESAAIMRGELKTRDIASIDSILNMVISMSEGERLELEDYIANQYITNKTL